MRKIEKKKIFRVVFALALGLLFYNNVYALPQYITYNLPEKMNRVDPLYNYVPGNSNAAVPNFEASTADATYKVFCLDRHANFNNTDELVKKDKVPYPLTYIALQSMPKVDYDNANVDEKDCKYAENIWIGQTAMWLYLDNAQINTFKRSGLKNMDASNVDITSVPFNQGLSENEFPLSYVNYNQSINESMNGTNEQEPKCTKNGKGLWAAAQQLAQDAANKVNPSESLEFSLSSGELKETDDGKSYKTDLIKVSGSDTLLYYSIEIPNTPKDTKVYDQDSKEITDLSALSSSTSFYLVIPKTSFASGKINVGVNAVGYFAINEGYYYEDVNSTNQPVMLVSTEVVDKKTEIVFNADTALNISNSIYFIGFVILLSGAGIIYANVKPRKQES